MEGRVRRARRRRDRMVRKKLGIAGLCLLLLCSCANIRTLVKTSLQGIPLWVTQPDSRTGKEVFVGQGTDENPFNARLEAMNDILSKLSEYLGDNVRDTYYREFTTTDTVKEVGLSVVREYRSERTTYLMVECDDDALVSRRSDVVNKKSAEDAVIADLLSKADQAYRDNEDVKAIDACLDAIYAIQTHLSSYDVKPLVKRCVKYIDAIRLHLSMIDGDHATAQVKVLRKQLLFSPKVKNAPVLARFTSENLQGGRFPDSLIFNTGDDGTFRFEPYDSSIVDQGTLSFVIDLHDRLAKLKTVLPQEEYQGIVDAVEGQSVSFPYAFVSPYAGKEMVVTIQEYAIDGTLLPSHDATDEITEYLADQGVKTIANSSGTQDGAELAEEIHALYPNCGYLLFGTVGVVEYPRIGEKTITVASGRMRLYDLKTQDVVMDTTEIKAVGESKDEAFSQIVSAAISYFSKYL